MREFNFKSTLEHSSKDVFSWHMLPGALSRLIPPWENVTASKDFKGNLQQGSTVTLTLKTGPISQKWIADHPIVNPPNIFKDVQRKGPFAHWEHQHLFRDIAEKRSEMEDAIEYRLPLSPLSDIVAGSFVRRKVSRMFKYRHKVLKEDLKVIHKYKLDPQTILLSGASGLLGIALKGFLSCAGHNILTLVRGTPKDASEIQWAPSKGKLDLSHLENIDTVIHLSGESIAQRWTAHNREKIITSRIKSTELLAAAIAKMKNKPSSFITASGAGIYESHNGVKDKNQTFNESSPKGSNFLAEVADRWEMASKEATEAGIRTTHMRLGAVMSPKGGALAKMLLPFLLGTGGKLGSGKQPFSWIAIDDVLYALYHVMSTKSIDGPINFVAPELLTNKEFTDNLGSILNRPTIFTIPHVVLRTLLGQMAEEILLSGTYVVPEKLLRSGFEFTYPEIKSCLSHVLGK